MQSEIDEENDKQTEVKDLLEKTVDVDRKSKLHTSLVSLYFAPRNRTHFLTQNNLKINKILRQNRRMRLQCEISEIFRQFDLPQNF